MLVPDQGGGRVPVGRVYPNFLPFPCSETHVDTRKDCSMEH